MAGLSHRSRDLLLTVAVPLMILLALVAFLQRSGSDRIQALPAIIIGLALLVMAWIRRRNRRRDLLHALYQERHPAERG